MTSNAEAQPPGKGSGLEDKRPGEHVVSATSVSDAADTWSTIRDGWVRSGDAMPRRGSLAWRALADDDPVKQAGAAVEDLGAAEDVRRYGPAVARALAELGAS